MRLGLCLLLTVAACTARPLGDGTTPTPTAMASLPETACAGATVTTLVPNIGAYGFLTSLGVEGDEVFFVDTDYGVSAVPRAGGPARKIADTFTQYVSAQDHHVFYSVDGCDPPETSCPMIADLDLATGTSKTFLTPEFTDPVVATRDALFGLSTTDLVRVDRNTEQTVDVALSGYSDLNPVLVGRTIFFSTQDYTTQRFDLDTNAIETLASDGGVYAIGSDGLQAFGAEVSAFVAYDANGQPSLVATHPPAMINALAVDDTAFYWSAELTDANLHVTPRDGTAGCTIALPGDRVITATVDASVVYVVVADGSSTFPLLRVSR